MNYAWIANKTCIRVDIKIYTRNKSAYYIFLNKTRSAFCLLYIFKLDLMYVQMSEYDYSIVYLLIEIVIFLMT